MLLSLGLIFALYLKVVSAAKYKLTDNIVGSKFFDAFTHETLADPTNGRVTYIDQVTAQKLNLSYATNNAFIMRVDSTSLLSSNDPGRSSVRIRSNKNYTTHVVVLDIRHMPAGCGTWPAAWETAEEGWPAYGEADILEGVNDVGPNRATLHSLPGCTMPSPSTLTKQSGVVVSSNCDASVNGNEGCSIANKLVKSYGPGFNTVGGGWYVMERTNSFIKMWFWPRNSSGVPVSVKSGQAAVTTEQFGTPFAYFPDTSCDFSKYFGAHNIIFNIGLCGDWAGNPDVFNGAGCPGTCADYVNANPSAFRNAYFDVAGVRVYQ